MEETQGTREICELIRGFLESRSWSIDRDTFKKVHTIPNGLVVNGRPMTTTINLTFSYIGTGSLDEETIYGYRFEHGDSFDDIWVQDLVGFVEWYKDITGDV